MDLRRAVAGLGRALISAGVLILLFVAYQLWGTGLAEARSQDRLQKSFQSVLAGPTTTTVPGFDPTTTPTPEGEAVAILTIPSIDVEKAVVEGVAVADLKNGPGHYPNTPMPGQPGNVSIAGHRTTYGAPFYRLDELEPGGDIFVTTRDGRFHYKVTETTIVSPRQSEVLRPTDDNRLTLTTCNPRFSASQRLVVVASLTTEPIVVPPPPTEPVPAPELVSKPAGLSGESTSSRPAVLWGALAAWVWLVAWLASRRIGRLIAYGLGLPVFLVTLFFFFENFARLLPANV